MRSPGSSSPVVRAGGGAGAAQAGEGFLTRSVPRRRAADRVPSGLLCFPPSARSQLLLGTDWLCEAEPGRWVDGSVLTRRAGMAQGTIVALLVPLLSAASAGDPAGANQPHRVTPTAACARRHWEIHPLLTPWPGTCPSEPTDSVSLLITLTRLAANITALAIFSSTIYLSCVKQQSIKYLHRIAQLSQS